MNARLITAAALLGAALGSGACRAQQLEDRLILSGDGATLTGTNGGGGGSINYLHAMSAATLLGAGVEYQRLAGAYWGFGSLSASWTHALTDDSRWGLHGEIHEGAGNNGDHGFDYAIEAIGASVAAPGGFSADLEERYIDVDINKGSLPKLTLAKSWGPHWLTTVGYAHSIGGNLNTEYTMARVDFYGPGFSLLAGGSVGRVNPVVLNINGLLQPLTRHLSEVFGGVTVPVRRVDFTLLADDYDLAGIRHFVATLNLTIHFR